MSSPNLPISHVSTVVPSLPGALPRHPATTVVAGAASMPRDADSREGGDDGRPGPCGQGPACGQRPDDGAAQLSGRRNSGLSSSSMFTSLYVITRT